MGGCGGVLRPRPGRRRSDGLYQAPPAGLLPAVAPQDLWRRSVLDALHQAYSRSPIGITYLCCFQRLSTSGGRVIRRRAAYQHATHYTGHCRDLSRRERQHRAGTASNGARLLEVILAAGLDFTIARVWPGTSDHWEAQLKRWRMAPRLCPLCDPAGAATRALDPFVIPGRPTPWRGVVVSPSCQLRVGGRASGLSRRGWRACGAVAAAPVVTADGIRRWVCAAHACRRSLAAAERAVTVCWVRPAWVHPADLPLLTVNAGAGGGRA